MTFFNVVSAILFVGAFREVLNGVAMGSLAHALAAGVLALMMFNDALFTSWAIEQRELEYKAPLMLVDLLNFLVVAIALVALNPTEKNAFQVELKDVKWLPSETLYWFCLLGFWSLSIFWSTLSGLYSEAKMDQTVRKYAYGLLIVLAVNTLLVFLDQRSSTATWSRALTFLAVLVYFALQYHHILKRRELWGRSRKSAAVP